MKNYSKLISENDKKSILEMHNSFKKQLNEQLSVSTGGVGIPPKVKTTIDLLKKLGYKEKSKNLYVKKSADGTMSIQAKVDPFGVQLVFADQAEFFWDDQMQMNNPKDFLKIGHGSPNMETMIKNFEKSHGMQSQSKPSIPKKPSQKPKQKFVYSETTNTSKVWAEADIVKLIKKVLKEEILKEEGFKLKSYTNIITSIENSKNTNLSTLIYALGIKHIGDQASKLLANFFASTENLINFLTELNQQKIDFLTSKNHLDLFNINGIGETTLNSFYEYFKDNSNYEEFKNLLNHLVINHNNQAQNIDKNAKLYGKTFLFTGTLSISRQEAKTKVEKQGGKVLSSISQSLDYLVTGDAAGSKLKKAQELNIKILTEESFNALLNNESINNESQ